MSTDLSYAKLVFLLRFGAFGSQWNVCGAWYNFLLPQHLKVYLRLPCVLKCHIY